MVSPAWETQESFMEQEMHLAKVTGGYEWALPAEKTSHLRHQCIRYQDTFKVYRGDKVLETARHGAPGT